MHGDVDFGDLQPGHPLDSLDDMAADPRGEVGDGDAVVGHDVQIDRCLLLAHLHRHPLGVVGARTGNTLPQRPDRARGTTTHGVHTVHIAGGDPRDLGDHGVGDGGVTQRTHQRRGLTPRRHIFGHRRLSAGHQNLLSR